MPTGHPVPGEGLAASVRQVRSAKGVPVNVKLHSRLAQRLDGEIVAMAANPARCAVLRVQRAILWLRHGRETEAREELKRLHVSALANPRIELAAWLHLTEGLVAYFSAFGGDGRDRVRRASVMASAARLPSLQVWAAAWLAQMDFVGRDIDGLVRHAAATFALLAPGDHSPPTVSPPPWPQPGA